MTSGSLKELNTSKTNNQFKNKIQATFYLESLNKAGMLWQSDENINKNDSTIQNNSNVNLEDT